MTAWHSLWLFVCGTVITSVTIHFLLKSIQPSLQEYAKENLTLAIGILSAPENFQYRDAIRKSWKTKTGNNIKAWFIIGNQDCQIHPNNRIDQYGCDESRVQKENLLRLQNNLLTIVTSHADLKMGKIGGTIVDKLNIKVMSDIHVKRLGVVTKLLKYEPELSVHIIEAWTETVIAHVKFSKLDSGIIVEDCVFQPIPDIILHKNYEYILEIENLRLNHCLSDLGVLTKLNNFGGILHYQNEIKQNDIVLPTMWLERNTGHHEHMKMTDKLNMEWKERNNLARQHLRKEKDSYKDILFVDTVDIYRNLPIKLLLFHKWLFKNTYSRFVLKTDDDCFVNMDLVHTSLSELDERNDNTFIWWGNFRKQWLVQKFGKWADFVYSADVYPAFACGSGNVVNRNLHEWIAKNADYLHEYQGEDVSMGIWMAAISPTRVEDGRWQCSNSCTRNALSRPELEPSQIKVHWENLLMCSDPCGC